MADLSILCVTRCEPVVMPFLFKMAELSKRLGAEFVLGTDRCHAPFGLGDLTVRVASSGYQEDVQDEVLQYCQGAYVLRLDDDETVSPVMERWLADGVYHQHDNWHFARAWLCSPETFLTSAPHWPDVQTRLSVKVKAGGRRTLHSMPPFGWGEPAPGAIEHHKLLIRSKEERESLLRHYDKRQRGAGEPFRCFYLPQNGNVKSWIDNMTAAEAIRRSEQMKMPMAQHGLEILACTEWLLERGQLSYALEIGTDYGGTAALWCELVSRKVISVDLPGAIYGSQNLTEQDTQERDRKLRSMYPHYVSVLGDSHTQETARRVERELNGEKLDLLFIDADHRYEGVKSDYEMYKHLVRDGGLILFHDINDSPFIRSLGVGVYRFWAELTGEKYEFNIKHEWGGLGLLVHRCAV